MKKTDKIVIRVNEGTKLHLTRAAANADRKYTDFIRRVFKRIIEEDQANYPNQVEDGTVQ